MILLYWFRPCSVLAFLVRLGTKQTRLNFTSRFPCQRLLIPHLAAFRPNFAAVQFSEPFEEFLNS